MYQTNGRVGGRICPDDQKARGSCVNTERHSLLPFHDARKWAEIAAEGGNPAAQEWLCRAADEGALGYGQPQEDGAAFKWCLIAAHNACASNSAWRLAALYQEGRGTAKDEGKANHWRRVAKQPWRSNARSFFKPQYGQVASQEP
jgi:TPR repeat protein